MKKLLGRDIKPTMRAKREQSTGIQEDQYTEELMDKPTRGAKSVELRIKESKNRSEEKERFRGNERRGFGGIECNKIVRAQRKCVHV